ncbi:hypothetical protein EZV62_027246 [Acer yangbiense]|uniref:DUF4408 domain-containing protein n=1 Tax=Acer yangbiense TaxID=1000413 RepID=A0A5C7GUD4_9ROSI|nr:hypothetical protein EZV62_027246 [Acer yangbiense]
MAMAKMPPFWDEKPSGAASKYREYPQRAKGTTSFIVFVFSIFVYMSIFYAFNLSPSTFLNNNKFWFFISNTLILIIAADYGAFSSSKNKHDLYEEYVMHSQLARSPTTNISSSVSPKKEEVEYQSFQENQEKALEIVVVRSEPEKITENFQDDEKKKKKNYRSSKSEKPRREVVVSKNITRSRSDYSETEKEDDDNQEPAESVVEENDEFSNMSDEELNRRVEEFIQSFNRQIRLQRDGNLLPLNLVN